jgi:L-malate glycosyltransferase
MKPLRISFVIDNLGRAGTESQLLALIRHLDRSRVIPALVLLDGSGDESRSLEPANCEVLRLGVTKLLGLRSLRAARTLFRHWQRQRPDVVQAYFLDPAYFAVPIATLAGVRGILRVRNNLGYWLSPKHRILGRMLRPLVSATLTNTAEGAAKLAAADRPTVVENGVDLDRYAATSPVDLSRTIVTVGCVANLRPVKNIDGLLRAAQRVCEKYPQVRFSVAGDGEQRAELERLHAELGLGDRFTFVGSRADIAGFLAGCDLFVLPSHSEGMSNAILEAMAAGRAIVATAVGGTPTLLRGAGVLVPAGNVNALSAAIGSLLDDPARARSFGELARQRAADFGRGAMVERFIALWQSLLQLRSGVTRPEGINGVPAPQVRCDLLQVP